MGSVCGAGWDGDTREVYEERLGIACDLGMDTSLGSRAELIARREADRAAAGVPASCPSPREGDMIDAALSAFGGLGLHFGGFLDDPPPPPPRPEPPSDLS